MINFLHVTRLKLVSLFLKCEQRLLSSRKHCGYIQWRNNHMSWVDKVQGPRGQRGPRALSETKFYSIKQIMRFIQSYSIEYSNNHVITFSIWV